MQVNEQLAQILDNIVDESQDTNIDTDIVVSTHDESIVETMQILTDILLMMQTGKVSKGFYDIGTVSVQ